MFHQYPYTDFHDINLDWIIGKIGNIETAETNTKQYSEDAEAAKDEAVQAKNDAISAKDDAVLAKGAAENARDAAQGYANDAQNTVSSTVNQINLLQSRVDNIIPDGTQTAGNTELLDIRVGADGHIYDSAGNAVRGQFDINQADIDFLRTHDNISLICYNADFPLRNDDYIDEGYTYDFSQPAYALIHNTSSDPGYFRVAIYQDSTIRQIFQVNVPSGDTVQVDMYDINTAGVDSWISPGTYFTDYTWSLRLCNDNLLTAKITMYTKNDESPLHQCSPYSNNIIVSTDGIGAFKDISNAVAYAKSKYDVSTTPVTIFIKNGLYTLSPVDDRSAVIDKGANYINIIGESRDGVEIVLNNTPAHNNQIIQHGGPSIIKNLSLYNMWSEDGSAIDYSHNAYCIHNDAQFIPNDTYETVVENCYLFSQAFAPVGAGLQHLQKQIYKNVEAVFNSQDPRPNGYNQHAPIYVHAPANPTATGCSVVIDDCTCIAKNGTMALSLPDVPGSLPYLQIPVSIRRTIGTTNGLTVSDVSIATHDLQPDCALNNVDDWNYIN